MKKFSNILFLSFSLLIQYGVYAQQNDKFFAKGLGVRKDTIVRFKDNSPYNYLPLTIISGKESGPTFTIVAGIHGYEYPPIVAVQEFMKEIDINKLKGTLIIIPIANIGSFYSRTPFVNSVDGKNLNNTFPGSESGTVTDQIANWITKQIIPRSDVFLDIHGGDANEDLMPFICYYNNKENPAKTNEAKRLAEQCNVPYKVSYPYTITKTEPAKYAFKQASQDNVAALSIEAGKLGTADPNYVRTIKSCIYDMLEYKKMYSRQSEFAYAGLISLGLENQTYIKVDVKGLFYSEIKSGDNVKKGQELGYITDEFGKVLQKIISPEKGIVLYKIGTPPVNKGETLFCIAK